MHITNLIFLVKLVSELIPVLQMSAIFQLDSSFGVGCLIEKSPRFLDLSVEEVLKRFLDTRQLPVNLRQIHKSETQYVQCLSYMFIMRHEYMYISFCVYKYVFPTRSKVCRDGMRFLGVETLLCVNTIVI